MLFELVCPNGIGTDYSEHYAIFSVKWQSGGSGGGHKASEDGHKASVEGQGMDESISGGSGGGRKASVEG